MTSKAIRSLSKEQWRSDPTLHCQSDAPYVVKGLVSDWPMVQAGTSSDGHFVEYVLSYYQGASVDVFSADEATKGRYFYNEQLNGFNFTRAREPLNQVLDRILTMKSGHQYVGSTSIDGAFPGLSANNALPLAHYQPLVSIWMGNQSRIAAHYDAPDNLACVVCGRRRFTLFPPEQIDNLYVGPIDITPAGQAISLVDFHQPDFEQFPRFKQALDAALVVELEPGDGIFIPSLWWHHVEGLSSFNALVNYWWRTWPANSGPGTDALLHALLNVRQLPTHQRKAWQAIFNYYVFDAKGSEHLPRQSQGMLGELDDAKSRQLLAMLSNKLRR